MKLAIFTTLFVTVCGKSLLLPYGDESSDDVCHFRWSRWSKDPGAWCHPISFENITIAFFDRNYDTASICYGSIVFSEEALLLRHRDADDCDAPTLGYDVMFPFHFVAEYGKVTAHYRIETNKVILREVNSLVRSKGSQRGSGDENFEASWALVITWDMLAWEYDMRVLVQAVLFCDDQLESPSCYAVYSYGDQLHIGYTREKEKTIGAVGWMRVPDRCDGNLCDVITSSRLSWEHDLWLQSVLGFFPCNFKNDCNSEELCPTIREQMKNRGLLYEIPSSRTADVRYLRFQSNIDNPGLFLFPLSKAKSTPESRPDYPKLEIRPKTVYIYSGSRTFSQNKNFTISGLDCGQRTGNGTEKFEVLFTEEIYSIRMPAVCKTDDSVISGLLPFWIRTGDVLAYLYANDRRVSEGMKLKFARSESFKSGSSIEIESRNESTTESYSQTVSIKWEKGFFGPATREVIPHIVEIQDRLENMQDPFLVTRSVLHSIPNNGSCSLSLSSRNFVVIQLVSADQQKQCVDPKVSKSLAPCADLYLMNQVPLVPTTKPSCAHWLQEEAEYSVVGGGRWFDGLERYYGCPQKPKRESGIKVSETDADFANDEVDKGHEWKYDPCCSGVHSTHVSTLKFCTHCECNEGADFCIISSPLKIKVQRHGKEYIHESTNQCCYDKSGSLIRDPSKGAGRASKEINSPYNVFAHYKTDIAPYLSCCRGRKLDPNECKRFREQRPVVIGQYYVPSYVTMTVVERDPHFRTLDGLRYTFNDLGVYTMLTLNDSLSTPGADSSRLDLQISTRRKGNGTILSGFAMRDNHVMVEGYLPPGNDSELEIIVNGDKFTTHEFRQIVLQGIEIREITSSEFVFTLTNQSFSIRVMITDSSILNIATTPPLVMVDDIIGLLGNFDGDPENDLCSRNGTYIPTNSTMEEIHEQFGMSWKVESELDWLFSMEFALKIEQDIQDGMPYEPYYEPIFDSIEEEMEVREICEEDETCILDLSLTQDFLFANTTKTLKNLTQNLEQVSSAFEETSQTLIAEFRAEKRRKRRGDLSNEEVQTNVLDRNWEWLTLSFSFLIVGVCIIQVPQVYRYWKRPHEV